MSQEIYIFYMNEKQVRAKMRQIKERIEDYRRFWQTRGKRKKEDDPVHPGTSGSDDGEEERAGRQAQRLPF